MIYHLEVEAKHCKVQGFLNGFPIYNLDGTKPAIFSKAINAGLIGRGNVISFLIFPASTLNPNSKFSIIGSVKKYLPNQMTGPDQGEIVTEFFQENSPQATVTFDNEFYDYSDLFKYNEPIENKSVLTDYGIYLRDILSEKNNKAILQEFDPKLNAFAIAYNVDKALLVNQFITYLNENYFANQPYLKFMREEINLRSWCDKRIWEIGIGLDFQELLSTTQPDIEGLLYTTKVFVSKVSDQLRVVR